jgi:hypothetical protein
MSIFANAVATALPPDPRNLIEGQVTSTITSGISFGADPALAVRTTVQNVQGINSTTASTLGPNFDRFSVPDAPQAFGVVGNLFQSGQDLVPMSNILSNFGGTFIGDELSQVNVSNLLRNPGSELSTLARNLSNSVSNQARQGANSLARSVVQDVKDIFRGAVNSVLNPAAAGTTNLGVTDSRLSYAFYGPRDASPKYSKGKGKDSAPSTAPEGFKGVEPILNPHYVFRLNLVANGMTSGDESLAQSRLLLDKESRMGVSSVGKKEVTLSAILSRFGGFSQKNPTPYRAADFLWLKYYNRIPLTRLVTLRRYMFPIQDNLSRSPYFGSGSNTGRYHGWSNNPVSQMVTYFGGDSGNDLSSILKISLNSSWKDSEKSTVKDIKLNDGKATDLFTLFESSKVAQAATAGTKYIGGIGASTLFGSAVGSGVASFFSQTNALAQGSGLSGPQLASGILGYAGLIDKARFSGIRQYLDLFNPYAHGGYLQDLYREPFNVIDQVKIRQPGLSGGLLGGSSVEIKFEYSLKSIGHINAKAAMLDIMANILATTHYRGNFWGGEARFYLNKGIFPLLDADDTIKLVRMIWTGDFDNATTTFLDIITKTFGDQLPTVDAVGALLAGANTNSKTPTNTGDLNLSLPTTNTAITGTQVAANEGGFIPERLKQMAGIDLLAGFFNLTGDGNSSIPSFQALRTGAPVGEWHLTVGNPFKPIAVIGNLVCTGVEIEFNNELGPDDFPTEMTASVTLTQGMSRANQDVESVFNDGFGPLYIPRPDLFDKGSGKDFKEVQEEISKQVQRQGIFDIMQVLPESTIETFANFTSISANPAEDLPSAHINTTFQAPPAEEVGPPAPPTTTAGS